MLKVGFGVTRAQIIGGHDGIGRYTNELYRQFSKLNDELDIYPYTLGGVNKISQNTLTSKAFKFSDYKLLMLYSTFTGLPFFGGSKFTGSLDIVHATDHYIPKVKNTPLVASLMDAIPISHPEWTRPGLRSIKNYFWLHTTKWADRIITCSNFSRMQISENFNIPKDKINVVPLGVDIRWFHKVPDSTISNVIAKYQLKKNFFLFVGTIQPRKNVKNLVKAYLSLPESIKNNTPLIIVGKSGWGCEDFITKLSLSHFGNSVRWLQHLPEDDLLALTKAASALVMPSLAEGFGLPVLEAFASKTPVITSNTTSLPEVAGDAALLVNPTDTASITLGMQKIIEDQTLSSDLIKKGYLRALDFSWENTALKTVDVYHQVLRERS